jgi:hypothetical protein
MKRWVLSAGAGILISVLAANAHHLISAVYDSSRQVKIEAVIREFQFINPHPFIDVEVKPARGNAQQWRLEMDNRSELVDIGMTAETLKQGDRIVVSGSPGRTQAQTLYINRLDRPADGFWYEQVGYTPRMKPSTSRQ